ncbi:MAG: hypothetical protein C4518_04520 [Desulfobacteraceae bacterium]|nr:MAG: hypothetical protein C4518_04520 [Desulfobacteraceae bacterium]
MNDYPMQSVVEDCKIDCLNGESSKDSIREGSDYAADRFLEYFKLLKEIDLQYKAALSAGDFELARSKDQEFYRTADKVAYYDNEYERLMKIWSQKTGGFYFTAGKSGMQINFSSGESCPIAKDDVHQIKEKITAIHHKVKTRQKIKLVVSH